MKLDDLKRWFRRAPSPSAISEAPRPDVFDRSTFIDSPSPIERELRQLLAERARPTIFDIGACEGEDSVRYSRLFPAARIYACEPVPSNIERCHATFARFGVDNAVVLPYAIAATDGAQTLFVSSGSPPGFAEMEDWDFGNKSSSLLEPDLHRSIHPRVEFNDEIEVETRRLDGLCEELGVEQVDFIHLDVQGAELMVLEGAGERLRDVTAIWLEVESVPLYRGQPLAADVAAFLGCRGFMLQKDTVGDVSGDQLWLNGRA